MRAMRVQLGFTTDESLNHLRVTCGEITFPSSIRPWTCTSSMPSVFCVQDIVHLGVKLKARLLKPSIVLPMGKFIATNSHFLMLTNLYGKHEHGLRARDLNHKDKQNYDAVQRMIKASHLLKTIPEAVGTIVYIQLMESVVNSYLDKSSTPIDRIEEVWFATFFTRYWKKLILLHSTFTLAQNFITSNAYMCIEINAHSLLAFIITLRDKVNADEAEFLTWILGSQSCEKVFRALRSMTGTFSTIVNFSMLGMLQRLHKLNIQQECMSKTGEVEGIHFPRHEKFGRSKGQNSYLRFELNGVLDDDIFKAMMKALTRARETIEQLGMDDVLKENGDWKEAEIPTHMTGCTESNNFEEIEDEDDNEAEQNDESTAEADLFTSSAEDADNLIDDIKSLHDNNIIEDKIRDKAEKMKDALVKTLSGTDSGIGIYKKPAIKDDEKVDEVTSSFVRVTIHGKHEHIYIRKTTAVWLLQDGERLSADRLFRIRATQPFGERFVKPVKPLESNRPQIAKIVVVGDLVYSNFMIHTKLVEYYSLSNMTATASKCPIKATMLISNAT